MSSPFVVEVHNYEEDPQSGAGNCKVCNHPKEDKRHPHEYRKALGYSFCVCGTQEFGLIHKYSQL